MLKEKSREPLLLANFGGPRTPTEVEPFLKSLLGDQEILPTALPPFLHRLIFSRVAAKRAPYIRKTYEVIGGGSAIWADTEYLKEVLARQWSQVLSFHRYLDSTHSSSFEAIKRLDSSSPLTVFPLFPHFSRATTGSIATLFYKKLPRAVSERTFWIQSYATHPAYIKLWQEKIARFFQENGIAEKDAVLLFSAHSLPEKFIAEGDPYKKEVEASFEAIRAAFPDTLCKLTFQSKFGRGKWLEPETARSCRSLLEWARGREVVLFIPISFTSDHIETLYEIEKLYLPIAERRSYKAYRMAAFNREEGWLKAIEEIILTSKRVPIKELLRR